MCVQFISSQVSLAEASLSALSQFHTTSASSNVATYERGFVLERSLRMISFTEAAAGREGAAWASQAAQPWVSALPEWWGPLQPAAEVQGDHGPDWRCPWYRQQKKGHGALDSSWEVWTSWCSSVDMGRSWPRGRSQGQAAW